MQRCQSSAAAPSLATMVYPEALKPLPTLMTIGSLPACISEDRVDTSCSLHAYFGTSGAHTQSHLLGACMHTLLSLQQICSRLTRQGDARRGNRNAQWLLSSTMLLAHAWHARICTCCWAKH